MSNQPKSEEVPTQAADVQQGGPVAVCWGGRIEEQYRRIKEHAETYPFVWGSYILVYGGFSLWLTYRWRKLRRTEDRVRVLQERLRKIVESEQTSNSAAVTEQPASYASLTSKPSAEKAANE